MKNIEALCHLYREIVGQQGSADLPDPFPSVGYYFCPLPHPKLWASIRFAHLSDEPQRSSASLLLYVPGAGPDGGGAQYLEIQAFSGPGGERFEPFFYERQTGRDPVDLEYCGTILQRFKELIAQ